MCATTGLFEDDQTIAVTQWTPLGTDSDVADHIPVDTAPADTQQSDVAVLQTSSSDLLYHPTELQLCKEFIESTCGCKKFKGKPCSSLFPL